MPFPDTRTHDEQWEMQSRDLTVRPPGGFVCMDDDDDGLENLADANRLIRWIIFMI